MISLALVACTVVGAVRIGVAVWRGTRRFAKAIARRLGSLLVRLGAP